MKWLWIGICILLAGSFVNSQESLVVKDSILGFDLNRRTVEQCAVDHLDGSSCTKNPETGKWESNRAANIKLMESEPHLPDKLHITEANPSRKDGMPSDMYKTDAALLDALSEYIGKVVYAMPDSLSFYYGDTRKNYGIGAEPIETKILALYRGIEVSKHGQMVSVGAVLLDKNRQRFTYPDSDITIQFDNDSRVSPIFIDNGKKQVRWQHHLSDPHKVYLDKKEIYKKLLVEYETKMAKQQRYEDDQKLDMASDRKKIQSAIERVKSELK